MFQRSIIANPYPCTLDHAVQTSESRVPFPRLFSVAPARYARRFFIFNLLTSFEREPRGPNAIEGYPSIPTRDLSSCAAVIGPIRSSASARVAAKPISLVCSSGGAEFSTFYCWTQGGAVFATTRWPWLRRQRAWRCWVPRYVAGVVGAATRAPRCDLAQRSL